MATENIAVRTRRRAWLPLDPLEAFDRLRWPFATAQDWVPTADMFERGGKLVIELDLPGLKKEDVEVSLDGGDLVLAGKREQNAEVNTADYYRMERACGTFHRRIALPFDVEAKSVEARFEQGVLHIEVPRPAEEKPRVQKVKVH